MGEEHNTGIGSGLVIKTKSFFVKCMRVWHTLKKPTKDELKNIAKVSAIGIAIVGLLGFVISIFMKFFSGLF